MTAYESQAEKAAETAARREERRAAGAWVLGWRAMGAWRADCQILPEIFALAIRVGGYQVSRTAKCGTMNLEEHCGRGRAGQGQAEWRMLVSGVAVVLGAESIVGYLDCQRLQG